MMQLSSFSPASAVNRPAEVEDILELRNMDDGSIVQNFRRRFSAGRPYTGAGRVMVAVNPCRDPIVDTYDRDTQVSALFYVFNP